jgi:VanZ family protein
MRLVKLWLPVIVWAAVILSASNDNFSSGHSQSWFSWLFGHEVPYDLNIAFRKLGHILAYGILGALAWRADRRFAVALLITILVASTDEYRQSLTATRTGTPWDVLLDGVGGWVGIGMVRKWLDR